MTLANKTTKLSAGGTPMNRRPGSVASLCRRLKRHDATIEQWALLSVLEEIGDPVPMSALAKLLGCSTASITGRVDKLEDVLAVLRTNEPGDRRVVMVEISILGKRLLEMVEGRAE